MRVMRDKILLVYDKECPACHYYCQLIRIEEHIGELILVDAREDSSVMTEVTERGWDIDQGMVLKIKDNLYYGADAIHMLSLLGSKAGWFNRLNYYLFKSKSGSAIIYPVLKIGRAHV